MKFNRGFWIALVILLVWLILGWFMGSWLGIKSPAVWYLRAAWWFLGVAGFAGYLFLRPQPKGTGEEGEASDATIEIEYNFTEASKRILAATGNKKLNSLPAVFILGDPGSAKTTVVTQSGIEPELIGGQAMQANVVIPTRAVNLWYARNTLFIDPGGHVIYDPAVRRKLFKKFLPVRLKSLVAEKNPPTRSVLLTMDCELFLQPGGANALAAKARDYQMVLSELSHELGSSFPVYVLFTKADRIPYFRDFVENLTDAEAGEMLGLSLPLPPTGLQGAYAEQQSIRLNNAFQTLYYSLADRRPVYLARERNADNLANIYEFPREFAKLRPLVVQFLTDLCRPSQLGTTPFLRGFYFSGVRPVTINDVAPAVQSLVEEDSGFDSGATRMFSRPTRSAPLAAASQSGSRRIPQWVFLRDLFPGILLADRVGTTAAQVNVRVNFVRRVVLASAAAAALAMGLWWTVSYKNNSNLVHDAVDAAKSVPSVGLVPGQIASLDSLQRLSKIRETLAVLNDYDEHGAPWSYRALLYKGSDIRKPLRTTYYAMFRRFLLQPTQRTLIQIANDPEAQRPNGYAGYQYVYNALKAYLITTNNHDKHWTEFVSVLVQHWKKDQPAGPDREALATANFVFYADELPDVNPYPQYSVPDKDAVANARVFLNSFPLEDSIYRSMLDSAGEKLKSIVFNRDYPDTADTVRNVYKVEPWFTKNGYANFQKRLQNPSNLEREEWVLGPLTQRDIDWAKIASNLRTRYDADFTNTWREFLTETSEAVPYSSYARASAVLEKLGNPTSPLMQLFCVASENTNVDSKDVRQAFQPVQLVTPPGCPSKLVGSDAKPYVAGLGSLSNALKSIGSQGNPNEGAALGAKSVMSEALNAENTLQLNFQPDPSDPKSTVLSKSETLLKDPIQKVDMTLDGIAGAAVNGQASNACAAINPIFRKYPFNPTSKDDATLQEVNEVLNPQTGKLWDFVRGTLAPFVQKSGSGYIASVGQNAKITPSFLAFLNHAALLSQALYHDSSGNPSMNFTIKAMPSQDVDHVTLSIDGVTLSGDPKAGTSQTFPWPGAAQSVELQARIGGSNSDFGMVHKDGLWAVWHALERAERNGNSVQWKQTTEGVGPTMINGHTLTVNFSLDAQSGQILRAQYFSGLGCPSRAVQ